MEDTPLSSRRIPQVESPPTISKLFEDNHGYQLQIENPLPLRIEEPVYSGSILPNNKEDKALIDIQVEGERY